MCSQVITIGIGIVFIIGGLSGELVLRGTSSGPLLALVGFILVIYGFARIASISRKARAATSISPVTTKPQPVTNVNVPSVDGQPVEIGAKPVTPAHTYVDLPDARELSTDKKALLLITVLQTRREEVRKDSNSIAVENLDRYLKNFPITEDEFLNFQKSIDAHREKMIADQVDTAKTAQIEQYCALLQEFYKIRFHWPVKTASR